MFCAQCGTTIKDGAKFCGNCGWAVPAVSTPVKKAVEPPPAAQIQVTPVQAVYQPPPVQPVPVQQQSGKITNKMFFDWWKEICAEAEQSLKEKWDETPQYTALMLKNSDCIINKVSQKAGLEVYYEYYHIDAVFYDKNDFARPDILGTDTKACRTEYWLKKIRLAFEHENDPHKAYQEIAHLLTTNTETRVLVTYVSEETTDTYADQFAKITEGVEGTDILLIFGFLKPDAIYWKGYELAKGKAQGII